MDNTIQAQATKDIIAVRYKVYRTCKDSGKHYGGEAQVIHTSKERKNERKKMKKVKLFNGLLSKAKKPKQYSTKQ